MIDQADSILKFFLCITTFFLLFDVGGGDVSNTLEDLLNICSGGLVEKLSKSSSSFVCTKGGEEEGACSTSTRSKASISSVVGTMFEHALCLLHVHIHLPYRFPQM